jgi:RNA polymerase sigma-70 factor (ECF subfamily)
MVESELMSMGPANESSQDAAFQRYVVPEIPALLRVARSLTLNAHDAEDLVQDTLLRAYQAIDRFDGAHARAWLFTILRNTHVNRNRKRRPGLLDDPHDAEAIAETRPSDPAELAEQSAFRDAVVAAIATLPEKNRAVVELVELDSCSYAEVALALAIPIGTVMSRLHRGRRQIREYLTERGFAPKKGRSK